MKICMYGADKYFMIRSAETDCKIYLAPGYIKIIILPNKTKRGNTSNE